MITTAVVAEWLRRWTRNPMGFPRAGSNPAGCEIFGIIQNCIRSTIVKEVHISNSGLCVSSDFKAFFNESSVCKRKIVNQKFLSFAR